MMKLYINRVSRANPYTAFTLLTHWQVAVSMGWLFFLHWSCRLRLQWQPQFSVSHSFLWSSQIFGAVLHLHLQVLISQLWVLESHCEPSCAQTHLQWSDLQICLSGSQPLAVWIQSQAQCVWLYTLISAKPMVWPIISTILTSMASCCVTAQCCLSSREQPPEQRWRMT